MKLSYLFSSIESQLLSVSISNAFRAGSGRLKSKIPAVVFGNKFLDIDVRGLSLNSKLTKKGYLFFCLSGSRYRGSDFINEAYSNGARAVVVEEIIKARILKDLMVIRVKDIIKCLGSIAGRFYDHSSAKLNMTAITGTNGKTTTTFIIENILKAYRKQTGLIGTINYRFSKKVLSAQNTTPDILTTYSLIDQMLEDKIKYLLIEVSSHALAQRRIEGIKFDQAVFTNLGQDHFDYHRTKENYFKAKSKLFTDYLKEEGTAIVNIDDTYGCKLLEMVRKNKKFRVLTYGINKKADVCADRISVKRNGCCFTITGLKSKFKLETNLLGRFNIYNALASIATCLVLNIPEEYIIRGLREIYVPGRLERVRCRNNISIFVDYAHTQDALRNILLTLKGIKGRGRLILVFGCGGDRDRDKRHKMGKIASELADFVIITSDNPRFEDPKEIISDIKRGIRRTNYIILADRKCAIEKAIDIARSKDIIVVAGKGHEDYQVIKDRKFAFNDRLILEDILSKRGFAGCLN